MGNLEDQSEELEVLESIFGDQVVITHEDKVTEGQILAHPVLPQPFCIISQPQGGVKQEVTVEFLPPIILRFRLPAGYPSSQSPAFVLSCEWLTRAQLLSLCAHLDSLWADFKPEVVLFRWVQFLQEDSLAHLNIKHYLDITPLVVTISTQADFGNIFLSLKQMAAAAEFGEYVHNEHAVSNEHCQCKKFEAGTCEPRQFKSEIQRHLLQNSVEKETSNCQRGRGRGSLQRTGSAPLSQFAQLGDSQKNQSFNGCVLDDEEVLKRLKISVSSQQQNSEGISSSVAFPKDLARKDSRAVVTLKPGVNPLPIIVDFNEAKQKEAFDKDWFKCKVCLCEKVGHQCLQFLSCHHVFCKSCMGRYFEVQIKEGNVRLLTCPEEKCASQATPAQVYELVGPELYSRYDEMLLESSLALMSDITYCPRTSCQFVIIKDNAENMATCGRCYFVFCSFCRKTYHGIDPCKFRPDEKRRILEEYETGSKETKISIEKRYGKKKLESLLEETMSEKWMNDCTKKCPNCSASIQKSEGCNKMVCWRCNTIFCWLCIVKLNLANPYLHFNDPKSKCYQMLFEGVEENEDENEWGFGEFL